MDDLTPIQVLVPSMGEFRDAMVGEILVKAGDIVRVGEVLIVLESDKATVDVPAPTGGTVLDVAVEVGGTVSEGSPILTMAAASREGPSESPKLTNSGTATASGPKEVLAEAAPSEIARMPPRVSPAVRKLARELGVNLANIRGTGIGGRIMRADLDTALEPPQELQVPAQFLGEGQQVQFGPTEIRIRTRVQRRSSDHVAHSWQTIPHVTSFDEVDITELEALRSRLNHDSAEGSVKVTLLAFLVRALVPALKAYPEFNASLISDQLLIKLHYHIGIAVDTPAGLLVPVIRSADQRSVGQIAEELVDLATRARLGTSSPSDLQGGTFTISSLGSHGGIGFTPIINHPQVAILGVSRARMTPVWDGSAFGPRLLLPVSLSWDHRVIDGVAAAKFLGNLGRLLADPGRMLV